MKCAILILDFTLGEPWAASAGGSPWLVLRPRFAGEQAVISEQTPCLPRAVPAHERPGA
jgi:hypothetical protein